MKAAHIEDLLYGCGGRADRQVDALRLSGAGRLDEGAQAGAGDIVQAAQTRRDFGVGIHRGTQRGCELVGALGVGASTEAHYAPAGFGRADDESADELESALRAAVN